LNNRCYGVYFNDSTKILALGDEHFYYIERVAKEDISKKYSFIDYPIELKKKIGLFNHFKGYLKDDDEIAKKKEIGTLDPRNLVYIKRWFRSKHAVIFRMSNKTVQVIFIDQTEIIINSVAKSVIYYNKNHERFDYLIHEVMQSENR
jgi:polo-like kinase 1